MVGINERSVTVAVKVLRYSEADDGEEQATKIMQEAKVWKRLNHTNVLRFFGLAQDKDHHLYLISPWMENGSLKAYLPRHPEARRSQFILDAARALVYLHEEGIIHGDIKASNILVSSGEQPRALLCDFGLSRRLADPTLPGLKGVGEVRWQAPELWDNEPKSFKSDSYSFGMTIYEVLSGNEPFHNCKTQGQLLALLRSNTRPTKGAQKCPVTKESWTYLWDVAERCWSTDAGERPSMNAVHQLLESGNAVGGEAAPPSTGVSTSAPNNIPTGDPNAVEPLSKSSKAVKAGLPLEQAG
ncbi:hypothetical protein FRB99_007438 [Tulasnella sp. 403]|nr:hypothetical protein FRB99_007438 [Tulasnella sp. 403]